jgi:glycosyltransferase involved in cell wall biosynthesis
VHVAVFLQYYHTPDCPTAARPYALVERLARDHDVTVITTRAWEAKRQTHDAPWVPPGAELVRFDVPYDNTMTPRERIGAFLRYAVQAVGHGLRMPRPDVILGSSTPLTAAVAAGTVARLRGVPWIFEVRDLWPDFPVQMGAIPWPVVQHALYGLEFALYRSAAQVVTLSPDMEQHVRAGAPSAQVETNVYGADFERIDAISEADLGALRQRFDLDRRFLVLYAGTFGRANAIPTLLDAARRLSDRSDVLVVFAGDGHHADRVEAAAQTHAHIRRLPPLPYPQALALFRLADVSVVAFRDRPILSTNSPAKFFDSLAAGTPVVVTNPGWTQRFVERHDCGWSVPAEAPDALADRLRRLLDVPGIMHVAGTRAQRVARDPFDRAALLDEYATLVERVVHSQTHFS